MKRFFVLPDIHSFRAWTSLRILSNSRQNLQQSKQERQKIDKVSFFLYKTINKMFQSGLMIWHVLKSHKNIFVFRSLRACDEIRKYFSNSKIFTEIMYICFFVKVRLKTFSLNRLKTTIISKPTFILKIKKLLLNL